MGNRTALTTTAGTTTYEYDAANRLTKVGDVTYTWDDRGNLLAAGPDSYGYDGAGRMITASVGGVPIEYVYNGDGLRTVQSVDGVETAFTWDLASPLAQVISDTDTLYLHGLDLLAQQRGNAQRYYLADGLGSVRQMVNRSGTVKQRYDYTPYGVVLDSQGSVVNAFQYTGEWWDGDVGLLYLRARWYAPYLNRFISPDTVVPDFRNPPSINRYLYAFANPINHSDPSGHNPVSYNGQIAAAYALNHWRRDSFNNDYVNFDPDDYGGDCTNFASQALWAGGLRDPRSPDVAAGSDILYWHEDVARVETYDPEKDDTWVWTPSLHDFLTQVLHFPEIKYGLRYGNKEVPHVDEQNDPDALDMDWITFLTQRGSTIKPGDVVFYWQQASDQNWAEWTHAAIVVGWGFQTYFPAGNPVPVSVANPPPVSWSCIGTQKPLVVEHSTGFAEDGKLPRSIDNTGSEVQNISIVRVSKPFWPFSQPWPGSW